MLGLIRRLTGSKNSVQSGPKTRALRKAGRAALYVDMENLLDAAQGTVKAIIEKWPEDAPALGSLHLYVRADRVALWEMWASGNYPSLTVTVKGVQHFSHHHSKNSADMAIAMDAIADFVTGDAEFVAVLSDDSDFMPVFAKLKDMSAGKAPFLWLVTDRVRTRSATIEEYFPGDHIHTVKVTTQPNDFILLRPGDDGNGGGVNPRVLEEERRRAADNRVREDMVDLIIRQIPIGSFKSTDCLPIIQNRWPRHPMARMQGGGFGTEFANKLWPLLEKRGVRVGSKRPRKYEMTAEAKQGRPPRRRAIGQ